MALWMENLEPTNSPYAVAKFVLELGNAMNLEFGHKIINLMPTNLYNPNDNFELDSVIPGLIGRMKKAKDKDLKEFEIGDLENTVNFYMLTTLRMQYISSFKKI